jgi:hypothetical protein
MAAFRWDESKEKYILDMIRKNPETPHKKFAEYFGITPNAVRKKFHRMGISVDKLRSGEFILHPEFGKTTRSITNRKLQNTKMMVGTLPNFPTK